jgi:hypothetical protein
MTARIRIVIGVLTLMIGVALSTQAYAGQDWEIEVHGGALISSNPTAGSTALPPPNPPVPFIPPNTFILEPVPSWFFGDGATILSGAVPARLGAAIVPLDAVLKSRFVERGSGGSLGLRVDRSLSPRLTAEASIDWANGQLALLARSNEAIKASEASFLTTWNALLSVVPGLDEVVRSDADVTGKSGSQVVTTGTLLINIKPRRSLTPYVALGAGYIASSAGPLLTLTGNYHFAFPIGVPTTGLLQIEQTDTVTVQSTARNTVTWVVGGGLKYAVSDRWGVRVDVRDHINRDVIQTTVSAAPSSASTPGTFAITLGFGPGETLVFSTNPDFRSTLSSTVTDFRTFKGSGIVNQVNASAGIFWRF